MKYFCLCMSPAIDALVRLDRAPEGGGEIFKEVADEAGVPIFTAQPKYCGDNAAMIAGLAFHRRRLEGDAALAADVDPSLEAGE